MPPIIKWGVKLRKTSLIWWAVGITLFICLEMAFYPSLHKNAADLNRTLSQLPASVKNLIGNSDYTSPVGYLTGRIFYLLIPLLMCILAIGLGSSLIGQEEDSGTLEVVLAKPISRTRLLFQKASLGLLIIIGMHILALVDLLAMTKLVNLPISFSRLVLTDAAMALFVITIGSFTFMLASLGGRLKSAATGLAVFFAFGGYILASLTANFEWLKAPARAFPFYYYRPEQMLTSGPNATLLVLGSMTVVFMLVSWLGFRNRDLKN